jgi:nucleoid-associated protein YgaU
MPEDERWEALRRLGGIRRYVVEFGDTLSGIARGHGWSWRQLYQHPCNKDFRKTRPDPNKIRAGDILHIPVRESPTAGSPT